MIAAVNLLAQEAGSVYFDFARLHMLSQWWHWLLLLLVCLALAAFVVTLYRYDSVELSKGVSGGLMLLRLAGLVGILFWFFDLEKRTERQLVKNSRAIVLVDTSLSMGLQDTTGTSVPAGPSRMDHVIHEFQNGRMLPELREQHDVVVYRFDQQTRPAQVAMLPKLPQAAAEGDPQARALAEQQRSLAQSRLLAMISAGLLFVSLLGAVVHGLVGRNARRSGEGESWGFLISVVTLIAAIVVFAVAHLRTADLSLAALVGLEQPELATEEEPGSPQQPDEPEELTVAWAEELAPRGAETRLGDALRYVVGRERGGPIGGIILISDGQSNEGVAPSVAIAAAQDAGIPVYPVGMGSDRRPPNARVVDLEAPRRVYPGDGFELTGYVQAYGFEGRTVNVELVEADSADDNAAASSVEQRRITLPADGEIMTVRFEATPQGSGQRVYKMRLAPPDGDHDVRDNEKNATVQVVDRKNRVLLLAGGPMREYRFLRNLLYRDRDTTLDVWLQSGAQNISQESDNLLHGFPETTSEMFEYDCIVAFDPDWQQLDHHQVDLLDRWVAENAGGLIVVAGPVHTPQWAHIRRGNNRVIDTIRNLYPVVFDTRGTAALSTSRFGGDTPWQVEFTRDGQAAQHLWVEENAIDNEAAWASFEGVYGYYSVKDPKPGAQVLARFSDPSTAIDGQLPIYMAAHYYGAGRVFFQASGEMWRIRSVDDTYFEQYYTRLIRWASEGRLLRDSTRGVLLVDKERALLGEHVIVRAMLTDPQHNPLLEDEVTASLVAPDSTRSNLTLRRIRDGAREGMFTAQFPAAQEGDYRIELQVPEGTAEDLLARDVRVRVPAKELERPERNDALMMEVAERTGGAYYIGMQAATNRVGSGRPPIATVMEPHDQITYLPGTPDKHFERLLMGWLMVIICGAFCLEWLIRRLSKLA